MKVYYSLILLIYAAYIDSAYCSMKTDSQTQKTEHKQQDSNYSEADIRILFNHLIEGSFSEIEQTTDLIFMDRKSLGYASPFSFNLYIDINRINEYKWPKDAVVGLIAHELAHIVSYQRRTFLSRMLFIWDYYISEDTRRNVEHEADEIAIEKGHGPELVLTRTLAIRDYDQQRVTKMKSIYYWPEDLENLIVKMK